MEVWLESLSMHLSVGMPLPADLLFDILHYRGVSPASSGSTTPEGIPPGHRSPALEPICEKKLDPATPLPPSPPAQNKPKDHPNYENIDFLKNDTAFTADTEKEIAIQKWKHDIENNQKYQVPLRRVPKNFTRNRLLRESPEEKPTNLSLQNIKTPASRVTEKYMNATRLPAIFKKSTDGAGNSGQSSGLVRNIIESLNRKEKGRLDLGARSGYGRSSLKLSGTSKMRSCSPEKYTALWGGWRYGCFGALC